MSRRGKKTTTLKIKEVGKESKTNSCKEDHVSRAKPRVMGMKDIDQELKEELETKEE